MTIKLIFSTDGKKIYGAQIVGIDGVDKRIDTLAVAIRLNAGISDLRRLNSHTHPLIHLQRTLSYGRFRRGERIIRKIIFSSGTLWKKILTLCCWMYAKMPSAWPSLFQKRSNTAWSAALQDRELDRDKMIIVFCAIGVRSYNAARVLMESCFKNVLLYPAGTDFIYQHIIRNILWINHKDPISDSGYQETKNLPVAAMRIDCSGLQCPGPIMKVFETMKGMKDGEVMEVSASDPGFARDIGAWCRRTGNTLIANERAGQRLCALVRKGGDRKARR
jgi:TusA-related sulfurtransferase